VIKDALILIGTSGPPKELSIKKERLQMINIGA
jgi:hypothetical protein